MTTRAPAILCGVFAAMAIAQISGMKQFGNRMEGITVRPNASEDFTFLALHHHVDPFPRGADLHVRFFLPGNPTTRITNVIVEALELQDSLHYYMVSRDIQLRSDSRLIVFEPWPTRDVIDPLALASSNVGVRASYRVGNSITYVPVDIYAKEDKFMEETYSLFFVTSQDLQAVDMSISDSSGKLVRSKTPALACNRARSPNCILFPAGTTQALNVELASLSKGEYRLHLVGHIPRTSETTSLEITFYHDPRIGE